MAQRLEQLDRAANEAKIKAIHLKTQLGVGQKLATEGVGMWAIAHAMQKLGDPASASGERRWSPSAAGVNAGVVAGVRPAAHAGACNSSPSGSGRTTSRVHEIKEQIKSDAGRRAARPAGARRSGRGPRPAQTPTEESLRAIEGMRAAAQGGVRARASRRRRSRRDRPARREHLPEQPGAAAAAVQYGRRPAPPGAVLRRLQHVHRRTSWSGPTVAAEGVHPEADEHARRRPDPRPDGGRRPRPW